MMFFSINPKLDKFYKFATNLCTKSSNDREEVRIQPFLVQVTSMTTSSSTEDSDPDLFSINLATGDKFNQADEDIYRTACNNDSKDKNAQDTLADWVTAMKNQTWDPFWMVQPSRQPLDPEDPRIDVYLKHFSRRRNFVGPSLSVRSSDR